MKLTWPMIIDNLKDYSILYSYINESIKLSSVQLLSNHFSKYESDSLLVGKVSEIKDILSTTKLLNIICITDVKIKEIPKILMKHNVLILHTVNDLEMIFTKIVEIFGKYNNWGDMLLHSLIKDEGIEALLDIGASMLENPINVRDSSLRLISYTKKFDYKWHDLKIGFPPVYETKRVNEIKHSLEKAIQSNKPLVFPPFIEGDFSQDHEYMFNKITSMQKVIGFVIVIASNRPIQESDKDIVDYLCSILSLEIQKNENIRTNKGITYHTLIQDLLEGRIETQNELSNRIWNLNWQIKKNLFIMVLYLDQSQSLLEYLLYIRNIFVDIVQNNKCIVYKRKILLLIDTDLENPIDKETQINLEEFCKSVNGYVGISQKFHEILQLEKYVNQANTAAELGEKNIGQDRISNYNDYILRDFFEQLKALDIELKCFIHPGVKALIEYDIQNSTQYLKTLYIYLKNFRNQNSTAKDLHLHRSSILYHLRKLNKILDVDLNDYDTIFHIQLSLKLIHDDPSIKQLIK